MYIKIPPKLENKLKSDRKSEANVKKLVMLYEQKYKSIGLDFFPDFTDHGIDHINSVLNRAEELITKGSWPLLNAKDASVLIQAILLHDFGMHVTGKQFRELIEQDHIIVPDIDKKTWKELWKTFMMEANRFSETERLNITGSVNKVQVPNLANFSEIDRRLIGEFLRRHHPRLCHEISVGSPFLFFNEKDLDVIEDPEIRYIAGLVGRSHGMNLRDAVLVLENRYSGAVQSPHGVKAVFLMALVRIADYLDIEKERAPLLLYRIRDIKSPFSKKEWQVHNAITYVDFNLPDPERILVLCKLPNVQLFLKVESLLNDIQSELDRTWAVLGEVFSNRDFHKLGITIRRITSNIEEERLKAPFVPKKMNFYSDSEILKHLIKPLYNNEPSCGIRELLQNALDACKERKFMEKDLKYVPEIVVSIVMDAGVYKLIIRDNGIGMNEDILANYFLKAGSSFRDSREWVKQFSDEHRKSQVVRSGRFGVGALASFLLGGEIELQTRHLNENSALSFRTSYNQESIDVARTFGKPIGSTLIIRLNEFLSGEIENAIRHKRMVDWLKYYVADNPTIRYDFNDNVKNIMQMPSVSAKEPVFPTDERGWIKFSGGNLDFYWTFNKKFWRPTVDFLSCNGFLVPGGYKIHHSGHKWSKPRVAIVDRDANLNLSLDRNSIYNEELPNEKGLLNDIYEEIIAELLALEFADVCGLKYPVNTSSESAINDLREHTYCHRDGYVLNTFSAFRKFSKSADDKYFYEFWLSQEHHHGDLTGILSDKTFYTVSDKPIDSLTSFASARLDFEGIAMWFTPMYHGGPKKRGKTILQYLGPLLDGEERQASSILDILKTETTRVTSEKLSFPLDSIQISSLKKSLSHFLAIRQFTVIQVDATGLDEECKLFREVYEKFLGAHVVIPFDFNERVKAFPLAFEKLSTKIDRHRKQISL